METVGIVGLGNAGGSLARGMAGKGKLLGTDTDTSRREALGNIDLQWMDNASALASEADAVLLSLPRPEISRQVIADICAVARRPQIVIETSTITPKLARDLAAMCREARIGFVDAAVAGGVQSMADGKVTFLVGGSEEDFALARPVMERVGTTIHYLGPVGAGSGAKVVNNGVMHALMVVLIEAAAMAKKLDIPMEKMTEILGRADGIMRPLEHRVRERMMRSNYEGGMSVGNARKDSMLALETAQDYGVPLFATLAAHTPYEIAAAQGLADDDYAALAKLWEQWCHLDFAQDS
jgi:3-hydroxyisobutyrate dehydrogenase